MKLTTPAADVAPARPGTLGIGTPALPSDLFAFIGDWQQSGTNVERKATYAGQIVSVRVSTFADTFERPTRSIVCAEESFINELPMSPNLDFALYESVLESASSFIDDNQSALFEAHGVRL